MISGTIIALVAAGRRRDAAFVGVTVLGASILAQGLKYSFHAPRPAAADSVAGLVGSVEVAMALAAGAVIAMSFLTRWRRWGLLGLAVVLVAVASQAVGGRLLPVETGFDAFPSSHAMCSMALVAAVTALAWRGTGVRHPVLAGLFLYAVGLGFARVCLGVHLPSDVVAGWCIALAWTIGCRVVWVAAVRTAPLEPRRHLPPS
jgi:membrane-associated phospholipid phosphatase